MTKESQSVKLLSRKVVLSWKKATESTDISWSEIFPIICALYELDNNFQNDNSFKRLNVEKSLFYTKFQKTLESLNLSHHNIHYFRRDTKHLLKTFIEVNRGIRKLQDNGTTEDNEYHAVKKIKGQEIKVITKSKKKYDVSADESLIPNIIIDEVVNFYIKLKKADTFETVSAKAKANDSIIVGNNHRRTKSAPRTISTMKVPVNDIKEVKEIKSSEMRATRRALPPIPKSPIYTPNFTTRYSPKFSPLVPPSVSPILTPTFSPPPSYNDGKKFTPPANANVITVKHPKIINLRKIKKKPLKINTNNYNDPEDVIMSPHDSPISPPNQFYPMEEDLQSAGLSITSPSLVNAPKRTASLKPAQKRLSYGRKAVSCISRYDDNRYPSPTNSYVSSSKHYSSILSPNTKSFVLSPSSRTVNNISPTSVSPCYSEASAPPVLYEKDNNRMRNSKVYRKVKSLCSFNKTPTFLPSEDNLPIIPPITPNYTEEIAPTVSKFNPITEDSAGFPLPPLNETENLELVSISPCLSSRFSSPTIQVPSYGNSVILNPPEKKKKDEDEDLSEIIDIYGDDKPEVDTINTKHISDMVSPTLFSSSTASPHPSIFKNNGLTMEGIKYTHRNSVSSGLNPLDILMFKEGSEGEDREVEMVEHFKELMQIGEMKGHSVLNGNMDSLEQPPLQEEEAISTTITDVGVIDGLEEDLLNHKVSQRRKSTNSLHSRRSMNSNNSRRSSMKNEVVNNEKTKSMLVVEKKEVDKSQGTPKDQDNKNQFRLSLLTSKSIPNLENSNNEETENTKMDTGMETIPESKNEDIKMKGDKVKEVKDETIQPTNLSTFGRAKGEKSPKVKTNRRNSSAVPSSHVEERVFPVFVHPIQLYNIIKMISTYTVNRLPHSAQPVAEHWMTTSNEVSKKLWEQLKEKEDVISQMIVYATFYDHVKGTAFPLNDPEHVFLKELISSATYVEDLKELPTSPSLKNKRYSFLGKDKEGYENQLFNRNLIMEIKKELFI